MKKYVFIIFLLFHLKTISAQKMELFSSRLVEVKLSKPGITLSLEEIKTGFTFDLIIINHSSDTILIPKRAKTNNRSAYSEDEIGYTIKKGGKEIKCTYYHD